MESTVLAKNARRLRDSRDLTQAEVASSAGVSLAAYSKVESGKGSPRISTVYKVAAALGVGVHELFLQTRELKAVRFRATKRLKRRDQVLAKAATWLDDFNFLLREGGCEAKYTLSEIPVKLESVLPDERPKEAARLARERMGLDTVEPIHDLTGLLAANGIKVLTYSLASDMFFGMSVSECDGGPAIVVNVWDRIPVERWIFSAAHELGHLLLHLNAYDTEVIEEDSNQEREADAFAACFLMPQEGFGREWKETAGLSFWSRILKVKRIYHVSYKTVLYRLKDLGVFDRSVWRDATILLKRLYPRQKITKSFEPEKLQEYDFVTDWLERLARRAVEDDIISLNRASEILDIPLQEMRQRAALWAEEKVVASD